MIHIQEISAEQREALAENERLQVASKQIEFVIEHTDGDVSDLLSRLRSNLEQIKALNTRELCGSIVHRR